jgi:methylglutaconyl-CoA hydratase
MSHFKHFAIDAPAVTHSRLRLEYLSRGVVRLVLLRPEVRNALDEIFIAEFIEALHLLKVNTDLRLLVIQGDGHVFCAGADLDYMKRLAAQSFDKNLSDAKTLGSLFFELAQFPVPVIAAVRGAAIGGGFGLVACADYCVAEAASIFSLSEVRLGLVPGVIGPYVIRKLGTSWAQKIMLSGLKLHAEELRACGLVSCIVPENHVFEDALEMEIIRFLQASPSAARRCKRLILDCAPLPDEALCLKAAQHIALARAEPEASEGLTCFFEKKPPSWQQGLPKERM